MKRTKKSKFLSMLLAIVMVVGMLPFASITASAISAAHLFDYELPEAHTDVSQPLPGKSFDISEKIDARGTRDFPNRYVTARVVNWWKGGTVDHPFGEKLTSGTFEAGETYIVNIEFTPKEFEGQDTEFTKDTKFYINDVQSKVYYKTLSGKYTCRRAFTVPHTQVEEVSITIDTIRSLMMSKQANAKVAVNTEGCYLKNITWYRGGSVDYPGELLQDNNFTFNDSFDYIAKLEIELEKDSPYYFSDSVIMNINGEKKEYNLNSTKPVLNFSYNTLVRPKDIIFLNALRVNIDEPVVGEFPAFSAEVEGEWSIYNIKWYKGVTIGASGTEMTPDTIFEHGETYTVEVECRPNINDGYDSVAFANLYTYVNGISANKTSGTSIRTMSAIYSFIPKTPDKIGMAFAEVEKPYLGLNPNYQAKVNSRLYTATVTDWYCGGTIDNPTKKMSSTDVFQMDDPIFVDVKFESNDDVPFSNSPYPDFYINGGKAVLREAFPSQNWYICRYKLYVTDMISQFFATVKQPLLGEKPSYTVETPSMAYTARIVGWYKELADDLGYTVSLTPMSENDIFEECNENEHYAVEVEFLPANGYEESFSTYYSSYSYFLMINGKEANTEEKGIARLSFTPINYTGITQFSASIDTPIAGQLPSTNVTVDSPKYTATVTGWHKGGEYDKPGALLPEGQTFEKNEVYYADVQFVVYSDEEIVAKPEAIINGEKAYLQARGTGSGKKYFTYRVGGFFALTSADVNANISVPKAGATPDMTASVSARKNYTAEVVQWYEDGTVQSPGTPISASTRFVAGKTYIVKVKFMPKDSTTLNQYASGAINNELAYRSGSNPLTFNYAFVAEKAYIPTVTLTDELGTNAVHNTLSSSTTGVSTATMAWRRNGEAIGNGTPITFGEYSGTISITAEDGFYFDEETKVSLFGKTFTGGSILNSGKKLFVDFPAKFVRCTHEDAELITTYEQHYHKCNICGEIFDEEDHNFGYPSIVGDTSTYTCKDCGYEKMLNSAPVYQLSIIDANPVVGGALGTMRMANSYNEDRAKITSLKWYENDVLVTSDTKFKSGKTYRAEIEFTAQGNFYFSSSVMVGISSCVVSYGITKMTPTDTKTAKLTLTYTPNERAFVTLTVPDAKVGMTLDEVIKGASAQLNGVKQSFTWDFRMKSIGGEYNGYNYYGSYDVSTNTYTPSATNSEGITGDLKLVSGRTYELAFYPNGDAYANTFIFLNDVSVINNSEGEFTLTEPNRTGAYGDAVWGTAKYNLGVKEVTRIDLDGLVAPAIGQMPTTSGLVVLTEGVTLKDFSWNTSSSFHEGTVYVATVKVSVEDGYNFPVYMLTITNCPNADTITDVSGRNATIRITFPALTNGVSFSGAVTSFGNATDTVTLQLKQDDVEKYNTTTTNSTYNFASVAAGNYTLVVSKNNHVTREYSVIVGTSNVSQNVEIRLIGDGNGDGLADITDYRKIYNHINGKRIITDDYELACTNLNDDNIVDITDYRKLYNHINNKKSLWS